MRDCNQIALGTKKAVSRLEEVGMKRKLEALTAAIEDSQKAVSPRQPSCRSATNQR